VSVLSRPWALVAAGVLFLGILWLASPHWDARSRLEVRQEQFFRAVEERRHRVLDGLVDERYRDSWGLGKLGLLRACDDLRRFFLVLGIRPLEPTSRIEGREGRYQARIRLEGSPAGPGALIRSEANRLETPFVFVWRRVGIFPWQWRLVGMENAGLTSLHGYDPDVGLGLEMLDME
jgi:hypothetical protein